MKAYGNASLPMVALYDADKLGNIKWHCYAAFAVQDGRWDGVHGAYCSRHSAQLASIYDDCSMPGELPLPKLLGPRCNDFLAHGGTCSPGLSFGALNGAAGACNLACGFNNMDTSPSGGMGTCEAAIASGNLTCEVDFASGGKFAGMCDFACGYCSQLDSAMSLASGLIDNSGTAHDACETADTYYLPGSYRGSSGECRAALVTGQMTCKNDFAYGRQSPRSMRSNLWLQHVRQLVGCWLMLECHCKWSEDLPA